MKHRYTVLLIVLCITLLGGFLRLFRLSQTLQFLGDQGRDALIVRRLLIEHDPVFIGPVTSVGNMYLGPLYYYFMLPFFALTYPSPMGPVYAVALLGTLTIPVLYKLGKELVGEEEALFAAILLSFGWVFIFQSRFSWNPNPAPFVSILMIWSTYKAWVKNPKYWMLSAVFFSILIQLHYLTLLSLPSAGIIWLLSLKDTLKNQAHIKKRKALIGSTIVGVCIFLFSLTPLILFDMKHEYLNARAFYNILFGKEEQVRDQGESLQTLFETLGRTHHILFEVTTDHTRWLNTLMIIITVIALIGLFTQKNLYHKEGKTVILVWLLVGIIGTSLYKSSIFDHYIAYLYPVTCLILGMVLSYLKKHQLARWLVPIFFGWFFLSNLMKYSFDEVGWPIQRMEEYAKKVSRSVEPGEPYSLVGINAYNDIYQMNIRYFLTTWGKPPLETENANAAKKLVIVNENLETVQKVMDSPIYEIVIFPEKKNVEIQNFPNEPQLLILRR